MNMNRNFKGNNHEHEHEHELNMNMNMNTNMNMNDEGCPELYFTDAKNRCALVAHALGAACGATDKQETPRAQRISKN